MDADAGDLLVGKITQLGQWILDVVIRTHAGSYNLWACKGVQVGGVQFGCLKFVDLLRVG